MYTEEFIKQDLYLKSSSLKTVRTYRQGLNAFQQGLAPAKDSPAPADDLLNKAQLDAFVIWMRKRGLSAGGCNMYTLTIGTGRYIASVAEGGTVTAQAMKMRLG